MILFFVLIVVLLIGLTTAAMMGKIGGFLADPTSSQSFTGIPDGSLPADALAHVHFDQALRGYRMDQVDAVIDALGARLRELESQIAAAADPDAVSPAPSETSDGPSAGEPADVDADPRES